MRILVALMVLLSGVARAEEDVERSRAHYRAAVSYFDAGEYAKALGEFESAARFSPRPEFEFNIARCHEMMGEAELAIARFKHYLELRPDARDRGEVEERMARLQKRLDAQRARQLTQTPPPPPPPVTNAPPVDKPKKSRTGLWIGLGVAAGVLVVGAVVVGVVVGRRDNGAGTDFWARARNGCASPCLIEDFR